MGKLTGIKNLPY